MKQFFGALFFSCLFFISYGQLEHDKVIGSSFGLGYAANTDLGTLRFNPYAAKYLSERFMMGFQVNTTYDTRYHIRPFGVQDIRQVNETDFSISAGVFARYITNPGQKFEFYLKPYSYVLFKSRIITSETNSIIRSSRALSSGLDIGLLFPVSKRFNMFMEGNVFEVSLTRRELNLNQLSPFPGAVNFGLEYKF